MISSTTAQAAAAISGFAVERSALVAVLEAANSAVGDERRHRHATTQPFAEGQDIRRDPVLLEIEQGAGAAHSSLDLIQYQQEAAVAGQLPQVPQEVRTCLEDAGFTLNWFQHDGNRLPR